MELTVKQHDTKVKFRDILTLNGMPVPLEGCDVQFIMRQLYERIPKVINEPATLIGLGADVGVVEYEASPEDMDTMGDFRQEWKVTDADAKILSFPSGGFNLVHVLTDIEAPTTPSVPSIPPVIPPSDIALYARLDLPNTFLRETTLQGLRLTAITLANDFTFSAINGSVGMDATDASRTGQLPPSTGNGQVFYVWRMDDTNNVASIIPDGTDLISGAISVNLMGKDADALLIDVAVGRWQNVGTSNAAASAAPELIVGEIPSGVLDGINTTFVLANLPIMGTEMVFLQGILQDRGDDYTIAGDTITYADPPLSGMKLRVTYQI
jgi:hypothetical protein